LASLSIVIPAYNEELRLPDTLTAIGKFLRNAAEWSSAEVLVVDDGSCDGTAAVVESYSARDPQVRLLRNPGNRGKGYAVRHGVLAARGDWVLFSDADLSTPISELEKLTAAICKSNAQVAIGSRALDRSLIQVHQSALRENAGRLFNLLMRAATGLPFWDTQCGFKLFCRDAARRVFSRQRIDGFGFDAEALFIARKLGYRMVEVPVRWAHMEGTKVSMLRDSARMFTDLFRIRANWLRGYYR
jgi:dolichyl-phosphate beta-glucosyltransferase